MCNVCIVAAAVSAPLLDVLASAAVEQPPLEMPVAASVPESLSSADGVGEPMPTVSADDGDVESGPVTSTPLSGDMSLLSNDELVAAPIHLATPRLLSCLCCFQLMLTIRT